MSDCSICGAAIPEGGEVIVEGLEAKKNSLSIICQGCESNLEDKYQSETKNPS
jgi:hypothetical protein